MVEASLPVSSRKHELPPELEPVLTAMQRVRSAIGPEMMEVFLQLDLTMAQFQALHVVWRLGRVSGRQLARELRVTPAAVVPLCDRLEEQGYIQRTRDSSDRRVWWSELTPAGEDIFERVTAVPRGRIGPALSRLSADDRQHLARILNRLADALVTASTQAQ